MDFTDSLIGPVSPSFDIPFQKYTLTPAGLLRAESDSGTENGIERPMVKSVSGSYLSRDFVFEVDVTIPKDHGDIAYVGFGAGRPNVGMSNEPSNAFLFRIHNLPRLPFYGIDFTIADPEGGGGYLGQYRVFERAAEYRAGASMRFRIEHRAGNVTMSIPELPNASFTFTREQYRDLFNATDAYLFFGNSSEGTTFKNASVRRP